MLHAWIQGVAGNRVHGTTHERPLTRFVQTERGFLKPLPATPPEQATCAFIKEKVAVLIAGPCGTGKSDIAQVLGHLAVRAGYDVLFTTQTRLLGQLHAARATDTFQRRFLYVVKIPLLIIDDFGLEPMPPPHDEDFHDLISERYECAATIVTSSLDFSEWGHTLPNRLLGAATLDRLRHGDYHVTDDGESFRAPQPLPQSPKKHLGKEAEKH